MAGNKEFFTFAAEPLLMPCEEGFPVYVSFYASFDG
jgi:hypothetical protein